MKVARHIVRQSWQFEAGSRFRHAIRKPYMTTQPRAPTRKDLQADAARKKICDAVIRCLDRHGYADTSINRIQELAGVSRGALTHHFPSKQALVAETANRLLRRALRALDNRRPPAAIRRDNDNGDDDDVAVIEAYLLDTWKRVVNTKEGRALVEILMATRTDSELHRQLADYLIEWDRRISESIATQFVSTTGDEDDVKIVWSICRTFLRGLIIQQRYTGDPATLDVFMKRFAQMVSPHIRLL